MLNMKLSYMIHHIVDQLLLRGWERIERMGDGRIREPGIQMLLDVRISYDGATGDGAISTFLWVLFSGNTHVWVGTSDHPLTPPEKWENVGNHDSCWADSLDSTFSTLYFNMSECVIKQLKVDVAPKDLTQFVWFSKIDPVQWVYVTHEKDSEKNKHGDSYWRKLVNVEPATVEITYKKPGETDV